MDTPPHMDNGHTPGPWSYHLRSHDADIVGPNQEDIGFVNCSDGADESTFYPMEANARLITAAPDMLAALKELLFDAFEDAHPDSVKKARAAIAKAEGTTS